MGGGVVGAGNLIAQQGADVLTGAASSTVVNPQDAAKTAEVLMQHMQQQRMGGSTGVTFGSVPQKANLPLPPIHTQSPGIPQGPFASTGEKKRADRQALYSTIGDIVKKAEDKHYQEKVQKLQTHIETIQNAIQGYNEAQAAGNKEAMDQNARIVNNLLKDPKISKEIAKAYDANLNPLQENKKKDKPDPAKDALKAAFSKNQQDYQQGKTPLSPQAQQLMQNMPQQMQMDPRLAVQAEMIKAGLLPGAKEQVKMQGDILKYNTEALNGQVAAESRVAAAKIIAGSRDRATAMRQTVAAMQGLTQAEKNKFSREVALQKANLMYKASENRTAAMRENTQRLAKKDQAMAGQMKMYDEANKLLDGQVKTIKEKIDRAAKAGDSKAMADLIPQLNQLQNKQQMVLNSFTHTYGGMLDEGPTPSMDINEDDMKELKGLFPDEPVTSNSEDDDDE